MKKFVVFLQSESGDDYDFQFEAKKEPKTDKEWLSLLKIHLPHEVAIVESDGPGPGVANTWLHVERVVEVK